MQKTADFETICRFGLQFKIPVQIEEDHFLLGSYELDFTGEDWTVFRLVTIPGVRTMSNGDPGYPDEQDYQEVGVYPRLLEALEKIGHLIITDYIDEENMVEAFS